MEPPAAFEPGTTVLLREIWQDRLWSARPVTVVRDTPDLIALYSPVRTVFKTAVTPDGERVTPQTRKDADWYISDRTWPGEAYGDALRLSVPGKDWSLISFLKSDFWYVNFEDPLRRTTQGFDYMDQLLDILVKRDGSSWEWKDEHEVKEAIELGLFTPEFARQMYTKGEEIVSMLRSGDGFFAEWHAWRPDPSWPKPIIPEGWDAI